VTAASIFYVAPARSANVRSKVVQLIQSAMKRYQVVPETAS
jgi:hypothetical protein